MALTRRKPLVAKTELKRTGISRGTSTLKRTEMKRGTPLSPVAQVIESLKTGRPVLARREPKPLWLLDGVTVPVRRATEPSAATVDLVLKRDGHCCVICGRAVAGRRGVDLHLHHRRYRSRGGHHQASNLITLCPACHDRVHLGDAKEAKTKGWALSSRATPCDEAVWVLTPDGPRRRYLTDDGRRVARKPRNLVTS